MTKRIGILGAGGIGSVVAGLLADKGHHVTLIDPWFEHISAMQQNGLLVKTAPFDGDDYVADAEKTTKYGHGRQVLIQRPNFEAVHFKDLSSIYEPFDMGFIVVNGYDTEWATMCLNGYVKKDGVMCCFQNGINDDKIARIVGAERTLGVVMTISAAVYEPGVALRTDLQVKCFKVGELDGSDTPRARELAEMLHNAIGPSVVTQDLWKERWSKLMVNCMNNALAGLTGFMTAETRTNPLTQAIAIQLGAEVIRVARAHGHDVEDVFHVTPDAILEAAAGQNVEQAKSCMAKAGGHEAGATSRPSFGQAVVKRRRTEIDSLNGYVAQRGKEKGVPTPFCDCITEIVHSLVHPGFEASPDHIQPLFDMLPDFAKTGITNGGMMRKAA